MRSAYARVARRLAREHAAFLEDVRGSWRRALDLGSGPGEHAALLAARGLDVVGLDVDPWMVSYAARRHTGPSLRFQEGDAASIPFPARHFDLVWASEAWHHFADEAAALAECRRVLRPGGELWIVEGRADMSRRDFRHAFHFPALPGLFGLCRLTTRHHGETDEGLEALAGRLTTAGLPAVVEHHGAWARVRGRAGP